MTGIEGMKGKSLNKKKERITIHRKDVARKMTRMGPCLVQAGKGKQGDEKAWAEENYGYGHLRSGNPKIRRKGSNSNLL